jgi:hypothetical protein
MLPSLGPSPWRRDQATRAFLPQMIKVACEIGIDPHTQSDFLWIAEKARDAIYEGPVPAPWRRLAGKGKCTAKQPDVYFNPITQRISEEHPAIPYFRQLFVESQHEQVHARRVRAGQRKLTAAEKQGLAVRRAARRRTKQLHRAAARVQRVWRGKRARSEVERLHQHRDAAACLVQAGYRGMVGRRRYWAAKREWAAVVAQKVWRGRAWRSGGGKRMAATVLLQRACRRWRRRKQGYDLRLQSWLEQENLAVRTVQQALRRRARAQRAKRDYELLSVVDASKPDVSFFEVRKITSGKIFGMRVFHGDAAACRAVTHLALLHRTKGEVPFLVRCHTHFRTADRLFMMVDWHVCNARRLQYGLSQQLGQQGPGMVDFVNICRVFAAEALLCLAALPGRQLRYEGLTMSRLRITETGHVAVSDAGLRPLLESSGDGNSNSKLPRANGSHAAMAMAASCPTGWVAWCFGLMLLELLTGLVIPADADELLRKQLVRQAGMLVDPEASNLIKACLLPGKEATGISPEELMAHPYFTNHSVDFATMWSVRPFGLSGPARIVGPLQVQREQLSYGAKTLEARLSNFTVLTHKITEKAQAEVEQARAMAAIEQARQSKELASLLFVATKLRTAGRIKEYRAVKRQAHMLERKMQGNK